ncbi:hypothetical protein MSAN_01173000 [Mycena sanguinolenta]|uniref:Uncharacterized protein n=1 Tax=Mycena sanguinolenta TaxID=230812 RepID=A0A8H6YN65_9AGAR|nr:hypothetical protein MSAN_01173000 [Mycena sanguinolenta]
MSFSTHILVRGNAISEPRLSSDAPPGLLIDMHFHAGRLQQRHESGIISSHAPRLRTLTLTSYDREIAIDSVEYFSQMPSHSLQFLRVFVPGEIDLHIVRGGNFAGRSLFCAIIPYGTGSRDFLCFRQLNAQNITALILKVERCSILTLRGWAPTNDLGSLIHPIRLPLLRHMRIGYIDDIAGLVACIYAPNLDVLVLHDVFFCPAMLPYTEGTTVSQTDLPLVFQFLAPSCMRLRQLSLVGVAACARDAVDAFFGTLFELTVLVLNLCHHSFSDALFQPEARYRVPKAIFPKLAHLNISGAAQTDLARFLLRHKTVSVLPLKRLDITFAQFSAAYGRPGIRSILAVVLEMNSREGMAVFLVNDPRIIAVSDEPQ